MGTVVEHQSEQTQGPRDGATVPRPSSGPTQRLATVGDPLCSCGRPPRVVYLTETFGPVPSCR